MWSNAMPRDYNGLIVNRSVLNSFEETWWYIYTFYHFLILRCAGKLKYFAMHYNDVIMSAMATQITSPTIVYSRRRSKKTSKLRVAGLCEANSPVTGEFSAQRASNAENVSIWWRHHGQTRSCSSCMVNSMVADGLAMPAHSRHGVDPVKGRV